MATDPKQGQAARTLALLWRDKAVLEGKRGPRPALAIEQVLEAAIALANRRGAHALTMRAVADELAIAPMSIYTHVASKAELLVLMVDLVHARMTRRPPASEGWRDKVRAVADDNRRLHERHPWLASLPPNRPPLGPGTIGKYEHELRAFEGSGLSDVQRDAALTLVLGFVASCVASEALVRASVQDSAQSDDAWWHEQAQVLGSYLDEQKYPLATRVGSACGAFHQSAYDPRFAYEFGLTRLLDGLSALIDAQPASPPAARPEQGPPRAARRRRPS